MNTLRVVFVLLLYTGTRCILNIWSFFLSECRNYDDDDIKLYSLVYCARITLVHIAFPPQPLIPTNEHTSITHNIIIVITHAHGVHAKSHCFRVHILSLEKLLYSVQWWYYYCYCFFFFCFRTIPYFFTLFLTAVSFLQQTLNATICSHNLIISATF